MKDIIRMAFNPNRSSTSMSSGLCKKRLDFSDLCCNAFATQIQNPRSQVFFTLCYYLCYLDTLPKPNVELGNLKLQKSSRLFWGRLGPPCTILSWLASTRSMTPWQARRERETSELKSTWPGVSIRFSRYSEPGINALASDIQINKMVSWDRWYQIVTLVPTEPNIWELKIPEPKNLESRKWLFWRLEEEKKMSKDDLLTCCLMRCRK